MTDLTGTTLKGYDLRERIGAGGFGAVYRAFQSTVGREVAIKIILPGHASQPEFIRRFEAEAQLVARLEHLHITPLYDFWRDPDGAYLVMRYLRGGSLKDLLTQGAFDLETTAMLLDQVASALAVAHRNQVIHRDIKPANILLDEDNNAYLADFGIAKDTQVMAGSVTGPDALVGSPDYLAPEQARNEPVTPQTDIYSLGVVLYEMLTGEHPFPDRSSVERLFAHLNEPLPEITTLDEHIAYEVNEVIQKATAKDPARRFADVMALAAAFREAAALSVSRAEPSLIELLTPREQEVLKLIVEGKSNREIADKLTVEVSTVKWYVNQIYNKLNVRSRVQAIVKARELNLIVDGFKGRTATTTYSQLPPPKNPYKGLRAFTAADERDFFGRERMVGKLLKKLEQNGDFSRFLAVVGPSGSGKSSLVRAGLIPALWRGELNGSDNWYVVDLIPGSHPLDELEVALTRVAGEHSADLREHLHRDERGLIRTAQIILPNDGSELLIVIDQFEEVFTLVEDEARRAHFLDLLHTAVTDRRSRVRVVATMRADFYDRPLHYPAFGEMMRERVETVLPLGAEELERAIVQPAKQVGVKFEEGLVASIVSEINYQPGALPLLQYALTELFEAHDNRKLTREAYEGIGRAVGALACRAEETYNEFDEAGQEAAKQMFLRLVTLGEGVEDTRRRVARHELLAIASDLDLMDEVIDTYAAYRLLSLDNDPSTRAPTVEVAHEAILREWERLREWLNDSRGDIRLQRQLANAAERWQEAAKDPSYLVRGSRLEQFEGWSALTGLALTQAERDFLQASLDLRDAEERVEAERQARETRLEQRARTVLQVLVAVFAIAALISGGLAFWANSERNRAEEETARAEAAEQEALRQASIGLAAIAERELQGANPELGVLLALEALEEYPYTAQAAGALSLATEEFRALRILSSVGTMGDIATDADWSPDGTRIAAAAAASPMSLVIWDTETDELLLAVDNHQGLCAGLYFMSGLVWSPTGTQIATAAMDNDPENPDGAIFDCGVVVSDAASGEVAFILSGYDAEVLGLDWSSNGSRIVTGHSDGTVIVWDADNGNQLSIFSGHTLEVNDVGFSPDGSRIASASDDATVILWDASTGEELTRFEGHAGSVEALDWSPDGTHLVTVGNDALPRVWDVSTGETLFTMPGHTDKVVEVEWSPDGKCIVTQSADFTVKLWAAKSGKLLSEIRNAGPHFSLQWGYVAFSPDSDELLTGASRLIGQVHIWDIPNTKLNLFGHSLGQEWANWSPDGAFIATSGMDSMTGIWDAATGEQLHAISDTSRWADWSPDSRSLAMPYIHQVQVFDVQSESVVALLETGYEEQLGKIMQVLSADWSPDGSRIAGGAFGYSPPLGVYVWDVESGDLLTIIAEDLCSSTFAKWSPDSTMIATPCNFGGAAVDANTPARIWDAATGELLATLESDYGWSYNVAWSPDGEHLLVTYDQSVAQIWDVDTQEVILTYTGHTGRVWTGVWSPDGKLIASTDVTSRTVKVWNSAIGEDVVSFAIPGNALTLNWSPDGTQLMITGDGFTEPIFKRVFASKDELIAHARECCVTRELTPEERAQFGLPPAPEIDP